MTTTTITAATLLLLLPSCPPPPLLLPLQEALVTLLRDHQAAAAGAAAALAEPGAVPALVGAARQQLAAVQPLPQPLSTGALRCILKQAIAMEMTGGGSSSEGNEEDEEEGIGGSGSGSSPGFNGSSGMSELAGTALAALQGDGWPLRAALLLAGGRKCAHNGCCSTVYAEHCMTCFRRVYMLHVVVCIRAPPPGAPPPSYSF